jgi:hypothetical protein
MSAAVGGGGLNAALAGQLVNLKVIVVAEGSTEAESLDAVVEETDDSTE